MTQKPTFARISCNGLFGADGLKAWALVIVMKFKGRGRWAPRARVLAGQWIQGLPFRESLGPDTRLHGHFAEGQFLTFSKRAWAEMKIEPVQPDELPCFLDSPFTTDALHAAIKGDPVNPAPPDRGPPDNEEGI